MSFPVRICFSKTGYAKYISHLDMMRCTSRLIARAGIPIWYTQGFNPHPYMVFCAALSVGTEGINELLDIKTEEEPDYEALIGRLNQAAPEGFCFKYAYKPQSEFKQITRAGYSLEFTEKDRALFSEFLASDEIKAEKKTKRGSTTVDFSNEMAYAPTEKGFYITLPCSVDRVISPTLLLDTFNSRYGTDAVPLVKRLEFFNASGEIFR